MCGVQNRLADWTIRLIVVRRKFAGLRGLAGVERRGGAPRRGVEVNLCDKRLKREGEEREQRDRQTANARALRFYI